MELRNAYLAMCRAFPGGASALATAIGLQSAAALNNRIYEVKGQRVHVDTALAMQAASGTTLFAEAVAQESGGTFVALPHIDEEVDNDELLKKFSQIVEQAGRLARVHTEAIEDGHLDDTEQAMLRVVADSIHKRVEELLTLTVRVYGSKRGE